MKYNVVISRTYATEIVVDADNIDGVEDWLESNDETINHEELEQCNIIDIQFSIDSIEPSPNEVDELADLVCHINKKLQQYSHVSNFIPNDLYKALEHMLSHDKD
jgi:hypothetical protein